MLPSLGHWIFIAAADRRRKAACIILHLTLPVNLNLKFSHFLFCCFGLDIFWLYVIVLLSGTQKKEVFTGELK